MAHLLRGKQAGIQNDLSAGISPEFLILDDINRYGINSQVSALAYDPVQSLVAVGTNETKFGDGQIYIFGQKRFCADKLLCLDARNDLVVFSLETKKMLSSYSPPGSVHVLCCDPSIDYAFLGMQSGEVLAYDMDQGAMAPLKIPSFWKEQDPRIRITPVMALAIHPRDIGSLLIGYAEGAVIYSFKQNAPVKFFRYELPRGAPGGDTDHASPNVIRHPRLTHAVWHPTGTFILTGHEDGSLVFWDAKDGRLVMARTLTDTNIEKPVSGRMASISQGALAVKQPLFKIVWCANQDPEDTAILISGGASSTSPSKGLTLFEMGRTPNYATSSWQILAQYLESPKRQRMLPTPPNTEVVDFCLIPRSSPYFAGGHDPIAILPLLASGEIVTMSFPSGYPVSPTNQLHVSLTFVHPFLTVIDLSPIERSKWLGLVEKRSNGPLLLTGGAEATRPMKRFESRNIVQTGHADGTVRLWDAGHGDEIENEGVLQVDVDKAVGRPGGIDITKTSLAGASGELAVGTRSGEVAIFRWGYNKNTGRPPLDSGKNVPGGLTDISGRVEADLSEGLLPLTMADMQNGAVTALKLSDVGFVAAGFEGGGVIVIDLRGPAIIFDGNVQDLAGGEKRGLRRHSAAAPSKAGWATAIEFSVMTLEGESYSSILLHIGTSLGLLATFKILPENGGRYGVQLAGVVSLDDRVLRIAPMHAETGHPAYASPNTVAGLRSGSRINGVILVVTRHEARIFKPASSKGASKSWDFTCQTAAVSRFEDRGYALVLLSNDGYARAFSIPALREIGAIGVSKVLDPLRFSDAVITASGDVLGWTGPAETALINVWGNGLVLNRSKDVLFNPELLVPPRPTISNMQWIAGTQYITPVDLDFLIGGPDRPPSKRMLQQVRSNEAQARAQGQPGAYSSATGQQEGYWAYMQRQVQERTEKLGVLGESVNKLEDASASWASEASKYAKKTKQNMIMGAVKGRFGL